MTKTQRLQYASILALSLTGTQTKVTLFNRIHYYVKIKYKTFYREHNSACTAARIKRLQTTETKSTFNTGAAKRLGPQRTKLYSCKRKNNCIKTDISPSLPKYFEHFTESSDLNYATCTYFRIQILTINLIILAMPLIPQLNQAKLGQVYKAM